MKFLVIVAEALLKDRLIHAIRDAGAKGFTVTEVSGEGSRH
jgi:nitrogen regulatory protein PII